MTSPAAPAALSAAAAEQLDAIGRALNNPALTDADRAVMHRAATDLVNADLA